MSLSQETVTKIRSLADEICRREGCLLYDVEFVSGSKGQGRILRVYAEKEPGGISLNDITNISRGMNVILDVEDPIPGGHYDLEVSSPGVERPLKELWHFKTALNQEITVQTDESIHEFNPQIQSTARRMKAKGQLLNVDEEEKTILVRVDSKTELKIPLAIITKSRLVYDYDANKGTKK